MANSRFDPDYEPDYFGLALCEQQGRLFKECQYDFERDAVDFITKYMNSSIAADIDKPLSFYHSMGIKPIGEYFLQEASVLPVQADTLIDGDVLFWIGYMYRYWAFMGESSKEIIEQVPVVRALWVYPGYHTLAVAEAVRMFKKRNKAWRDQQGENEKLMP